ASSRSQESPYWGGMGRSAEWDGQRQGFRNFRLAGYAIGTIPFMLTGLLLVYLVQRKKPELLSLYDRRIAWLSIAIAVVGLMLSWGKHFPLYRVFYALPFMDTIRNPDKWLGPFTLGVALSVALGVDLLARLQLSVEHAYRRKQAIWAAALCAVIPLMGIISLTGLTLSKGAFVHTLESQGFEGLTEVAWRNAKSADVQVIVVSLLAIGIMLIPVLLKRTHSRVLSVSAIALLMPLMTIDLTKAIPPFVIEHDYKHILRKNPMTEFFDAHVDQGRIKILPPDMPLLNNWRLTYLAAGGYDLFDPVSVSRMPSDYQALFAALQSNPSRLWELGAIRYLVCPLNILPQLQNLYPNRNTFVPRVAFGVTPSGNAYLPDTSVPPNQRALAIVENTAALPMAHLVANWSSVPEGSEGLDLALERLAAPAFDLHTEAIVHGDAPSLAHRDAHPECRAETHSERATRTTVKVSCTEDMLLVRAVKYDPDWQVTVDGKRAELRRVNYMLQGVFVPANAKDVVFSYTPPIGALYVAILSRALLLALLVLLVAGAIIARRKTSSVATSPESAS
ncbi:MAG: YfhO family protein, partial [Verrucomicrobia bacterium]|nr:YfhO family protein [Verrucomicrobiota bacterium]